jgi:AraC-like DNA-binding protein
LENTNFVDFVNGIRIEKAQCLLKETDLKVEDIAERVGLPSKTTFIRLFKKYTSMIPSQYRSIHKDKKTI